MTLDDVLAGNDPTKVSELSAQDLARLFWKYKGLQKHAQRDTAFWLATNDNLKIAYEKLDEQERLLNRAYQIIREDLEVARQVQQTLLPRPFPEMEKEVEIAVYHKQLSEVGGDYYDFFRLPNERYAVGLFDISGHGVSAALLMTFLKAQFMQAMKVMARPKEIVEWVNQHTLSFLRDMRRYATINLVAFEPAAIRYVSGGGYGLLAHRGSSTTFVKGSSFLGLRAKSFEERQLPFEDGDLLVLYTDGMIEAQDKKGVDYSAHRLNELVLANRHRRAQEIVDLCVQDYLNYRSQDSDDITLIVLRRRP